MKLRIFSAAAAGLFLSGCTLGFEATLEDLSLMRNEPADIVAQFPARGAERPNFPLTGMLRLDFATDIDLLKLAANEGYFVYSDIETCGTKTEISAWGVIYENVTKQRQSGMPYHYSIFFDTDWRDRSYDLRERPEPVCVLFRATKMVTMFYYQSNTVEIDRSQVIRAFEAKP